VNRHAEDSRPASSRRNGGRRSRGPIVGILLAVATVIGFLAGFSDNVVKLVANVGKLLGFEPVSIALPAASMTIKTGTSADALTSLPILFTVVVTGHRSNIECDGEAEGQVSTGDSQGLGDEQIKLSSKTEAGGQRVSIDTGRQRKLLVLKGSIAKDLKFTLLNFRLDCGNLGYTEWVPVDVVVEQAVPTGTTPPQPTRVRQSFRICAGNGGGESCAAGTDAYYTCDQYNAIGGGAQVTYDTLAKKFCEYKDGDKTILAPNQVIHNFSRGGGQCGWTGFTVVCNP
jgi:hypothetical protein